MHQTTTQEVTRVPATTDNLLTDSKHKEVKLEDKVKVNKAATGSRVVLKDNNKEADTVNSKADNKAVLTVNNKEPLTGNKAPGNTRRITVQRK